jgi:hypothetical protein
MNPAVRFKDNYCWFLKSLEKLKEKKIIIYNINIILLAKGHLNFTAG